MSLQLHGVTREHRTVDNRIETEWLATFPSHKTAFEFIAAVYGIKKNERLPWGNGYDDGYLSGNHRYYIKRL